MLVVWPYSGEEVGCGAHHRDAHHIEQLGIVLCLLFLPLPLPRKSGILLRLSDHLENP